MKSSGYQVSADLANSSMKRSIIMNKSVEPNKEQETFVMPMTIAPESLNGANMSGKKNSEMPNKCIFKLKLTLSGPQKLCDAVPAAVLNRVVVEKNVPI